MNCESNFHSIHVLDEQIGEHERTLIKLKRARNSLLNVSKLPPEVLGDIFRWMVIRSSDFGGLDRGSCNFLLVCHYWFEVASRTPDLWDFWGNTLHQWCRWYPRSRTAPLDLVLVRDGCGDIVRFGDLYKALKDRAANDTIRRVHLDASDATIINSVLHPLTANCEELRSNSLESFVLWNGDRTRTVDASAFFARHLFPKLQRLDLKNCTVSLWDHLSSRTSALTTLALAFIPYSRTTTSTPSTSQLLSILSSNPALQRVDLSGRAVPNGGSGDSSRVRLHHLNELRLDGDFHHVFRLLNRLDHPRNMDILSLILRGCDAVDISRIVGPYLRDCLQCRDRFQNGLNLSISGDPCFREHEITFRAGNASGIDFSTPSRGDPFARITMFLNGRLSRDVLGRAAIGLIAYTPREEVVHFRMSNRLAPRPDTYTQFPNLRALSFDGTTLTAAFPNLNLVGDGKIFPSLEHVLLERIDADGAGWRPLVTFLAHRVSSGNRLDALVLSCCPFMSPEVKEGIRGMVRELRIKN